MERKPFPSTPIPEPGTPAFSTSTSTLTPSPDLDPDLDPNPNPTPEPPATIPPRTDPLRPRILIVEDERSALDRLGAMFRRAGWNPIEASSEYEATRFVHSSVQDPPDVYLIDLKLPGGKGGRLIELIRLIGLRSSRTRRPVRVIAYTGCDVDDPRVVEAVALGADAVIAKPREFDAVLKVVLGESTGDVPIPPRSHEHLEIVARLAGGGVDADPANQDRQPGDDPTADLLASSSR